MMTRLLILTLGIVCCSGFCAEDDRPILKEPGTRLVPVMDANARADFVAACIRVTRDVRQKRLTVFAVSPYTKSGTFKEGGFEIEVIYNGELAKEDEKSAGTFYQHNNGALLGFAASQYTTGDKALGLRLIQIIADAHPKCEWSSPEHPPVEVKDILTSLSKDDATARTFLKYETEQWAWKIKTYGP